MTRYNNQTPANADKLGYRDLLNNVTEMVANTYHSLSHDDAQYVADLMVRHDEDVVEINGQYIIASEATQ